VERAIEEQGALGAQVLTSTQGRPLDHTDYDPFFALMAELDRPIWIHPNRTVQWSDVPAHRARVALRPLRSRRLAHGH
jgi:predicted TIM-barrel fold metal-dependent hydrolase